MKSISRVVSARFSGSEYEALQSMSMLTGLSINQLIREACSEHVMRFTESTDFDAVVEQARQRAAEAHRSLVESLGTPVHENPPQHGLAAVS